MYASSLCIKTTKNNGEKIRILTNNLGIIDRNIEIRENRNYIYIPILRKPREKEILILKSQVPDFQLGTSIFAKKKQQRKTLAQVLEKRLPQRLLAILPRALDIVGDIAIIEIPAELKANEKLIGEAILTVHKNVRTVLAKAGAISGTYRLRGFEVIAGENKTTTIHKEYGCKYHVDIAKAYFSPRLSHEHKRVASVVEKNETIVDMFAGVGPFSVLIAKNNAGAKVYAVDINPDAIKFLKINIRRNRVENRVTPILGDARHAIKERLLGVADRVIMNLPERAIDFVDTACKAIKPAGGVIHYYAFVGLPNSLENEHLRFSETVKKAGRKVDAVLFKKTIRETAPYEWQIVLDTKIL